MEREKGIRGTVLIWLTLLTGLLCACIKETGKGSCEVTICMRDCFMTSKAAMPEEGKISNINLLIFDSYGRILENIYRLDSSPVNISLIKDETYTFAALANFGYKVDVTSVDDLESLRYHLAYPDEYREGMPMTSEIVSYCIKKSTDIQLPLINMMSKISIRIDRNQLSEGVEFHVSGIRIGNCPKSALAFRQNKVDNADECFNSGFSLNGTECNGLNTPEHPGMSKEVSLYMFENMQGDFSSDGITSDEEKIIPEDDPRFRTCSYVEIDIDYTSRLWQSKDSPLTYRFYLGDGLNSLDMERNCHYHITVIPEDDGLDGDGWRVDKTGLHYTGQTLFEPYPSDYIVGNIGEKIHIGCRITPQHTPFDVGIEYMEDDKAAGIYDYTVDPDGHGVTLTLTGPGTGLIYMEAGPPINDGALFLIEVNLPT